MSAQIGHAVLAIAAAAFDSLWEGALIAGAVWLGLRCLPQLGAATRYAIWLCALAAVVLVPVLTVGVPERLSLPANDVPVYNAHSSVAAVPRVRSSAGAALTASKVPDPIAESAAAHAPAPVLENPAAPRRLRITISQTAAAAIAFIWILVAAARGVLLLLNLRALAAIRREARLWSTEHEYPVFLSHRVRVPIAAGFVRPAIILPPSLVEELNPDAVETIVLHEVAHLRRFDVWTNALARIAQAFVALDPAAWFIMRRLSTEREIACDDWVVARTGSGDVFANVLAGLAKTAGGRAPLAAPSALGSRHSVVVRIERLLDARPRRLRLSSRALGAALVSLAIVALLMQTVSPVLAYEPQQPPGPTAGGPVIAHAANAPDASTCAEPNRGVRMAYLMGRIGRPPGGKAPWNRDLPDPRTVVAQHGSANVAAYSLVVDAAGHARKIVFLTAPRYPGMAETIKKMAMATTYEPALRNCVPVAAKVVTAFSFEAPVPSAVSVIAPAYPKGWSARYKGACKVPSLIHMGVPAFPESMKNIAVGSTYTASVRVHVDGAGGAENAAVVTSSGQRAFDDALLAAARQSTYPLTDSDGFREVRPSNASPRWNAAHGASTYTGCRPLPTEYVWNTTFERTAPFFVPKLRAGRPSIRR